MSFNTAQLYDSQDLTSEGISSPGYSVSSSLDGLNNPPNWNFVYRQECVSVIDLSFNPFQLTTSIFDQQLTF